MIPIRQKIHDMDNTTIETRRIELLDILNMEAHPLEIFFGLEQSEIAAFVISDTAASTIRRGLSNPYRRDNESSALAKVEVAATTPDHSGIVYLVRAFHFENLGTADAVLSVERDRLKAGEIEVHTHLYNRPDYLGNTDVGDLIAAIEGPAWVDPATKKVEPALRIFGVLSVYFDHLAELQFYVHDLRHDLSTLNNYGLKRLGQSIRLLDAY